MKLRTSDIELIRAAASLAAHAPQQMVATHLASKLEELARRLELALGGWGQYRGDEVSASELRRAA